MARLNVLRKGRMFLAAVSVCASMGLPMAAWAETKLLQVNNRWQLTVDGKPFEVKGIGGAGPKDMAKAAGANSFRTWDANDIGAQLDEAQKLGMKVTVGIWLEHERHGFSYRDSATVAKQIEKARVAVEKYKDHPAVLMWAIGNEMEGEKADNPAIWLTVNHIAAMIKKMDPTRPTMTVMAEIGGERLQNINRFCPDVDIIGINTYAGATSIPQRYRAGGGTKPYIVTEFGPPGTWEIEKDAFGAVQEPNSTSKAESYRAAHVANVADPLCLGTYAFTWGQKQEATATWFGMLLKDNTRLGAADVMQELWTGKPPANRVPVIGDLVLEGSKIVQPGSTVKASVELKDPEADKLEISWELHDEADHYGVGGDAEEPTKVFPEAIISSSYADGKATVEVKMPETPAVYRLYVLAKDGKGGAATATTTMKIPGAKLPTHGIAAAPGVKLPYYVYNDVPGNSFWIPSGWMGNAGAIRLDEKYTAGAHTGATCIRVEYAAADGFGGIAWQHPADDWGDRPGGQNLSGATKLTFYAKGEAGGERVEFKLGILGKEKPYHDTASAAMGVTLTNQWKKYELDVSGQDLSRIKTGFVWSLAGQGKPVVFYVDEIRYE